MLKNSFKMQLNKSTPLLQNIVQIGKEVSEKAKNSGWGKSVVEELSNQITANFGQMRGFSPQNIRRMKQFYETYKDSQILSTVLRELSRVGSPIIDATPLLCGSIEYTWTNNLLVMSCTKNDEERLFYIRVSIDEKYSYL